MAVLSSRSASSFQAGVTTARTAMVRLIDRVVPSDMGTESERQASQPQL